MSYEPKGDLESQLSESLELKKSNPDPVDFMERIRAIRARREAEKGTLQERAQLPIGWMEDAEDEIRACEIAFTARDSWERKQLEDIRYALRKLTQALKNVVTP